MLFFSAAIRPGFSWPEMEGIRPPLHRGAAAEVLQERYFEVQYWCGGIALVHLLLEWIYAGRFLQKWILYWILVIVVLDLLSGLLVQPKLTRLHLEVYG